jgi:alanine dehydrogenase
VHRRRRSPLQHHPHRYLIDRDGRIADDRFFGVLSDGEIERSVANMPGAVARTSTFALNNATLPFTLQLVDKGWRQALKDDIHLRNGLNVCDGKITCKPVANAHGLGFTPAEALID